MSVVSTASASAPIPQASPMAPASHIPAPVVSPRTAPLAMMIDPAARKATPDVTASIRRKGSVGSSSDRAMISYVSRANTQLANEIRMWVRSPAVGACSARSNPIAPPSTIAATIRASASRGGVAAKDWAIRASSINGAFRTMVGVTPPTRRVPLSSGANG